jgi:hypothetical protein
VLFSFVFLFLLTIGAGPFSLDAVLAGRRIEPGGARGAP